MKMKLTLAWVIICSLACNSYNKDSDKRISEKQSDGDSLVQAGFMHHFYILDSIAHANTNDTIFVGSTPSIEFMEVNTGIQASSEGTLVGKIKFSTTDLKEWHEWYNRKYKKNE